MKTINKLLLINWSYLPYTCLEFGRYISMFVGPSGSGKSSIIDAMQLLILGDTDGRTYFNKAASEKSDRTLEDYLRGMNQDSEATGKKYLRNDDFTSYVVMEMTDTVKNKKFCIGIVCDVSPALGSNTIKHRFFILNQDLPKSHFVENNIPLSIDKFVKRYDGEAQIFEYNKAYRETLSQQYLGKLKFEDYCNTFKKAVAFSMQKNIRDFIVEFICEDNEINVEEMRQNVKIYKQYGMKMRSIEEQIQILSNIREKYKIWEKKKEELQKCDYVVKRADLETDLQEKAKFEEELKQSQKSLEHAQEQIKILENKIATLNAKKEDLKIKINESDENKAYDRLTAQLKAVAESLNHAQAAKNILTVRGNEFMMWINYMDDWTSLKLGEIEEETFLREIIPHIKNLALTEETFTETNRILGTLLDSLRNKLYLCSNEISQLKKDIAKMQADIKELETSRKYPTWLTNAKEYLHQKLSAYFSEEAKVWILADLIEIKDTSWTNTIEGLLNNSKLSIIVPPKYYKKAAEIFRGMDNTLNYHVRIVNIEPIMKRRFPRNEGSLAEEIETSNMFAAEYVNYLLGRCMKCEKYEDLSKYDYSATKDCHTYQSFQLGKINPRTYTDYAYIGNASRIIRIESLKTKIREATEALGPLEIINNTLGRYKYLKVYDKQDIEVMLEQQAESLKIPDLEEQKKRISEERGAINLYYVQTLQNELTKVEDNIRKTTEKKGEHQKNTETILPQIGRYNAIIPEKEAQIESKEAEIQKIFNEEWIKNIGEPAFKEAINKYKAIGVAKARYMSRYGEENKHCQNAYDDLVTIRKSAEKKGLSEFDTYSINNDKYDELLDSMSDIALPEIKKKISEQEEKAIEQMRTDLIAKLHASIKTTMKQINYLNNTIRTIDFGINKYQFAVSGSRKYQNIYNMLMDPDISSIDPISNIAFRNKHEEAMTMLFELLSEDEEEDSSGKNSKKGGIKYTDYRTFLEFEMTCETDGEISDLSKTMSKNSGGEAQVPFYIAIFASFAQLYRMERSLEEDTPRFIILDEAFSKMGEEHVSQCVTLLKALRFQAIISAPDEKLRSIGSLSDYVFVVRNEDKKRITVSTFKGREKDIICS